MSQLVETAAWLVGIPSPTGEEGIIRDAIQERLHGQPHVVVGESLVIGEASPGSILLVGHMDTVPLQGESGSRVDDGRLYGLGSTDMKAGLAVMIHLIEELGTQDLAAIFYAGEEGPMAGNQLGAVFARVGGLSDAGAGIVLEPTNRELQAGCNGSINATVSFIGEPAHSARPWLGVNAITRSAGFLKMMDESTPEVHNIDGLEFKEVMSVTRGAGGVANNVIPGQFDLNVNYRFAPDRSDDEAKAHLADVCSGVDRFVISDIAPAAYPNVNHALFQELARVAGAEVSHKQGWTDVALLTQLGVPAVNFGPGETDLAHKPGESVRLDDLDWAYQALFEVLSSPRRRD